MPVPTPDELRAESARLAAAVCVSRTSLARTEALAVTARAAGLNRAAIVEKLGLTPSTHRDRVRDWPAEAAPARSVPDALGTSSQRSRDRGRPAEVRKKDGQRPSAATQIRDPARR